MSTLDIILDRYMAKKLRIIKLFKIQEENALITRKLKLCPYKPYY